MIQKLNIRKRLIFFGAVWLTVCTVILTLYLFSEGRKALLEGAVKRSQTLADKLAGQARSPLYAGNEAAVEALLQEAAGQPGILAVRIELKEKIYGTSAEVVEPFDRSKGILDERSRLVRVNGLRAVESFAPVTFKPESSPGETDEIPLGNTPDRDIAGLAVVHLSVEPVFAQVRTLMIRTFLSLLFVLAAGLITGWALTGRMVSPLRRMADHARALAEGEGADQKALPVEDEIEMVLSLMNAMRRSLDYKTKEISGLQMNLKDTSKKGSDLEEMNARLSDLLNQKNDLIRLLNHEVKTPLGTISTLTASLQDGIPGPVTDRQRDYLNLIKNNADRVRRVITVMLQYAIARTGAIALDRRQVEISGLAHQVDLALRSFQEERQVRCILGESIAGKSVYADTVLIDQILYNLIHNAVKASPPGATVRIEALESEPDLVISVADAGHGIPDEIQTRLLREPLTSDAREGGGFGLYISRYLVELHGGRIWFETGEGKGTTFFFTLPGSPIPVTERV